MTTIRAFVGPNGSGKTLAAVATVAAPALASGRQVVANFAIDHPHASRISTVGDLPKLRDCVLILDEVTSVFPSREFSKLPAQVARLLNQLRKVDVQVVWTAPNWARADVIVREVTQTVTLCRGSFVDPWMRTEDGILRDENGRKVKRPAAWPSFRLFHWTTYDAVNFEEFTLGAVKGIRPLSRKWYRRNAHAHQWMYDTQEQVDLFDHLDTSGTCINCHGTRPRPKCTCGTGDAGAPPAATQRDPMASAFGWAAPDLLPGRRS